MAETQPSKTKSKVKSSVRYSIFFIHLFVAMLPLRCLSAETIRVTHPPLAFEISSSDPELSLVFDASFIGKGDTEPFLLESPPRLVVDLGGVIVQHNKDFPVDHPSVQKIRIGRHPERTRIVFDLVESQSYSFHKERLSNGALQISLVPDWVIAERERLEDIEMEKGEETQEMYSSIDHNEKQSEPIVSPNSTESSAPTQQLLQGETPRAAAIAHSIQSPFVLLLLAITFLTSCSIFILQRRSRSQSAAIDETKIFTVDFHDPYEVLGCTAEASDEEIRTRYRKLLKAFHGDTLASHDLPSEVLELTTQQMNKVRAAFEQIQLERRWESESLLS